MSTTLRISIEPELLLWAQERAGLDHEQVAKVAPKFDEWVAQSTMPTLKQAEKFAKATHTPFGFLLLREPPHEELPVADFRMFATARPTRPSPNLLDTIYACEQRQEWYRAFAQQYQLDPVPFVGTATTSDDVERIAAVMRETFDFELEQRSAYANWTAAIAGLAERAEAAGVLVMINGVVGANTHRKLDPAEFRGFALSDDLGPVVFVNGADTKAAQIFTLAHELAHLWLGTTGVSNSTLADREVESIADDGTEGWCNQVAAEFLVPLATLAGDVADDDLTSLLEHLAREYRVSTLVILRRLRDKRVMSWDRFRDAYEAELDRVMGLKASAGGGGNFYNTQPVRVSKEFARAIIADTLEGRTLHRDAFHLLGIKKVATFDELRAKLGVG